MPYKKINRGGGMATAGYSAMGKADGTILQVLKHDLKTGKQTVVFKHPEHKIINATIKSI